jgi:hypothetical protein
LPAFGKLRSNGFRYRHGINIVDKPPLLFPTVFFYMRKQREKRMAEFDEYYTTSDAGWGIPGKFPGESAYSMASATA